VTGDSETGTCEERDGDTDRDRGDDTERRRDDEACRSRENARFLLDVMCGRLARYLRFCGYDAAYALDRGVEDDDRILSIAREENRTLITRDVELAERAADALLVTERAVTDQLAELAEEGVDATIADEPRRCGRCNGRLERSENAPADGERSSHVSGDRPDHVPDDRPIWRCRDCGHRFWRGSHWERVAEELANVGNDSDREK
jgi:uncharacterized protein with PIN domain